MNWKILIGLLALVATASAVPLGPYSIDYDLEDAIYAPIAQVQEFTADGVGATAYAGVILAPDGWALIIVNDFEEEVGLSKADVWAPFGGALIAELPVVVDGRDTFMATDGSKWRTTWALQADGWEDGILYGSDTVAVTMGGWDRSEVEAFLGSIHIKKDGSAAKLAAPTKTLDPTELEGMTTFERQAALIEAGLQLEYPSWSPV